MNVVGKTTIETFEEPDGLHFVVKSETGWIELIAAPVLLTLYLFICWPSHKILALIGLVTAIICWGLSLHRGQEKAVHLFVNPNEFTATGNLIFTTSISIPISEIKRLDYFVGHENEPQGLYVEHGWQNSCVLPGLTREETEPILRKIRQRYPNLEQGDTNPNSLFLSTKDTITRLNLHSD